MNCLFKITRTLGIRGVASNFLRYLNTKNCQDICSTSPPLTRYTLSNNPWMWQQNDHIKLPFVYKNKIELPNGLLWMPVSIEEPVYERTIEAPCKQDSNMSKEASRMLIIRRKKMKKHKLRKLRKKMKFEWGKRRQKRELKKEKLFQAVLIQQCKEAEEFSAEKYVQERIDKLNEIVIPRRWKGKKLPEFIIREKMGLPPMK